MDNVTILSLRRHAHAVRVPVVYQDCDNSGLAAYVFPGDYPGLGDPWNDSISAICVFPGLKLTAWEHPNYEGTSYVFAGDGCWKCLGDFGYNDAISSLKVGK